MEDVFDRNRLSFVASNALCDMLLSKHSRSFKGSGHCTLLVICVIAFLYYSWTNLSLQHTPAQVAQSPHYDGIPRIIWYKLGPNGLNADLRTWTDSCIKINPTYEARFMTDEEGDEFVKNAFASRPDIVASYLGLTVPILKADLLRYMFLFDQGGIWSDLDISCEGIPIDDWVPAEFKAKAELVVGWEFDWGWGKHFTRQFASWTIMARPGTIHMLRVIEDILDALHEKMRENNVSVENITLAMIGDVVDFSGPRRLTRGIFKSLQQTLNRTVEQTEVSEILQPKLLGDVLVMPGRSFGASSNHYTDEEIAQLPPPLVTHHYAGSWKNAHGGEQ
jgi:alpha 1,6-mannosyltransferase